MALHSKSNYTMAEGMKYIKSVKKRNILIGILGIPFPFIPPFYLGFDPRIHSLQFFYLYLVVYLMFFFTFLGICCDKSRKVQQVIHEKAILLGCPVEIKEMGAKGSNTYSATVKVNERVFPILQDVRIHEEVEFLCEEEALWEPYAHFYPIGSGVSGKFIDKNVPHYDIARKMGEYPEPVSTQSLEESESSVEENTEASENHNEETTSSKGE